MVVEAGSSLAPVRTRKRGRAGGKKKRKAKRQKARRLTAGKRIIGKMALVKATDSTIPTTSRPAAKMKKPKSAQQADKPKGKGKASSSVTVPKVEVREKGHTHLIWKGLEAYCAKCEHDVMLVNYNTRACKLCDGEVEVSQAVVGPRKKGTKEVIKVNKASANWH